MKNKTQMFVVGKWDGGDKQWEFSGVFDSREKAEDHAISGGEFYFVGPCFLNEGLPESTIEWPGGYYPFTEGRKN